MGAGIANGSGIRGHLVTRWQQGKPQYMLKLEPLDPRDNAGFAAVAANPPTPISINIRLLDSTGFALCGKEIVLRFDPAARAVQTPLQFTRKRADTARLLDEQQANLLQIAQQEKTRESGKDIFQNIQGSDGSVEALWAQGDLPCSPDQYKRFDYWDMATNFPTLAEQDVLLGHVHLTPQEAAAAAKKAKRRLAAKAAVPTFYMEGDDQINMYEASRAMLTDDSGRSFFIPGKTDQTTAANWASNYSHIHFKCDQHDNCALRTGSGAILARMSE